MTFDDSGYGSRGTRKASDDWVSRSLLGDVGTITPINRFLSGATPTLTDIDISKFSDGRYVSIPSVFKAYCELWVGMSPSLDFINPNSHEGIKLRLEGGVRLQNGRRKYAQCDAVIGSVPRARDQNTQYDKAKKGMSEGEIYPAYFLAGQLNGEVSRIFDNIGTIKDVIGDNFAHVAIFADTISRHNKNAISQYKARAKKIAKSTDAKIDVVKFVSVPVNTRDIRIWAKSHNLEARF